MLVDFKRKANDLRRSASLEATKAVNSNDSASGYKLHLAMDAASHARLMWLKANLEAATESEVIRRALKAYEIFEPADDRSNSCINQANADKSSSNKTQHLYIRISRRMKDALDIGREQSGLSYGDQVSQALCVLMQFARDKEAMMANLKSNGQSQLASCKSSQSEESQDSIEHRLSPNRVFPDAQARMACLF